MHPKTLALIAIPLLLLSACGKPTNAPATGSSSSSQASSGIPEKTTFMTKEELETRAMKGDKEAQFSLGVMLLEGNMLPKNTAKGIEWLEKAANQGVMEAQFNLGLTYLQGGDVPQDFEKAKTWLEKAAAQGNDRSQYNLGIVYYQGLGTKVDYEKAMELFMESAKQGFSQAQFNLGVMYAKGQGKLNAIDAYAWFTLAAERGDPQSISALKDVDSRLSAEEKKIAAKRVEELRREIVMPKVM